MEEELKSLLDGAASGDETAFARLTELYAPLIRSMSEQFAPSFAESVQGDGASVVGVQDLEQEARLALFRAARSYDTGMTGVSFGLYAKICIRNSLVSELRRFQSARRKQMKAAGKPSSDTGADPLRLLVAEDESRALTGRIRKCLSAYENRIFELYSSGRSVKSISLSVGKPEKSVNNALYRIRVKIKGLLEKER